MTMLSKRLIAEREARGLTQEGLAAKAKIGQSFIGALEAGNQQSSKYIPELAYALGLSAMWLKNGIGPKLAGASVDTEQDPLIDDLKQMQELAPATAQMWRVKIHAALEVLKAERLAEEEQREKDHPPSKHRRVG